MPVSRVWDGAREDGSLLGTAAGGGWSAVRCGAVRSSRFALLLELGLLLLSQSLISLLVRLLEAKQTQTEPKQQQRMTRLSAATPSLLSLCLPLCVFLHSSDLLSACLCVAPVELEELALATGPPAGAGLRVALHERVGSLQKEKQQTKSRATTSDGKRTSRQIRQSKQKREAENHMAG
jgi:hypothetical protein